jgi:hypothetical protein
MQLGWCNWVDAIRGVVQDRDEFISIDLNRQGYKSEPFMLAKHIAQVFCVPDTTNKRLNVVIPEKRWIVRVESAIDEVEFYQFDEIPPFVTLMIKDQAKNTIGQRRSLLVQWPPWKSQEFQKTKTAMESSKMTLWNMLNVWKYGHLCENLTFIGYLCEICSMCENLTFIWYLCQNMVISEVCVVSEVLCSVSDGHYTEFGNCSIFDR